MDLHIDIVTPDRLVMQGLADSVIVPAADGELGILPNHAPLLAQLQPGQIHLRRGDLVELFAISGGYVEIRENRVLVFAETAEMAREIDVERARQAAERAKAALREPESDIQVLQAEAALRRALARLHAYEEIQQNTSHSRVKR
ncbi:MAG: F0F1 ATP synthase subunit epsilon [Elusimicrobiota bacterium]|jgi:F-type H+-transporting ATPase subunit epsilon